MFLFLLSLFCGDVFAQVPVMEVVGSQYAEIYIDKPVVKQDGNDIKKYDYSPIVLSMMAQHHEAFYRRGIVSGIYDVNSVELADIKCNFKKDALKCGAENDLWVLKSVINITYNQAYVTLMLYDEIGNIISSATVSKKLRRKIIPRKKRTTTTVPGGIGYASKGKTTCSKNSCDTQTTGGTYSRNASITTSEDLPPTIINFPAVITNNDVRQAVMMLYMSIR